MNRRQRPGDDECFDYHRNYVALVPDGDIVQTLRDQQQDLAEFISSIPAAQTDIVHPPYGWSIRQVIEHCVDGERVFGYRTLRFAAGDPTDLPGWDENHYAAANYGPHADLHELAREYADLRSANAALLSRLDDRAWSAIGTADGRQVSVRTLAWLMAGHWLHHQQILSSRLSG